MKHTRYLVQAAIIAALYAVLTHMQNLLLQTQAMFAGGDVPQADKDKFFQAVMEAYVATKEDARERFTNKRYKK